MRSAFFLFYSALHHLHIKWCLTNFYIIKDFRCWAFLDQSPCWLTRKDLNVAILKSVSEPLLDAALTAHNRIKSFRNELISSPAAPQWVFRAKTPLFFAAPFWNALLSGLRSFEWVNGGWSWNLTVRAVSILPALDLVGHPTCFAACQNCLCFYAMKLLLSSLGCFQLLLCNGQKDALADFVVTKVCKKNRNKNVYKSIFFPVIFLHYQTVKGTKRAVRLHVLVL